MFTQAIFLAALTASTVVEAAANLVPRDSSTTITAWGIPSPSGFAGSVVSADASETTLVVSCTTNDGSVCGTLGTVPFTLTNAPSTYQLAFSGKVSGGASGKGTESCSFSGAASTASEAVCVLSALASAGGAEETLTTTVTLSGTQIPRNQIPITAGANKLSGTSSGNAAAATGISEVYKVLVPMGAALVGAAMM